MYNYQINHIYQFISEKHPIILFDLWFNVYLFNACMMISCFRCLWLSDIVHLILKLSLILDPRHYIVRILVLLISQSLFLLRFQIKECSHLMLHLVLEVDAVVFSFLEFIEPWCLVRNLELFTLGDVIELSANGSSKGT